MKQLILTSAGFDNKAIEHKFIEMVGLPVHEIKVVFIPTAAITDEQKSIIPLCKNDLLNAGILDSNIETVEIDTFLKAEQLLAVHAIYVCGGSTQYLLKQMHKAGFKSQLDVFLDAGGVYIGVSAGSIALAGNSEAHLNYLGCPLKVHSKEAFIKMEDEMFTEIHLTDNQAVLVIEDVVSVIE